MGILPPACAGDSVVDDGISVKLSTAYVNTNSFILIRRGRQQRPTFSICRHHLHCPFAHKQDGLVS
jgi:hypothetical protein